MTMLSVEGLCKTYPTFHLNNVHFTVEAGSITGFMGRNGAGKSTTLGTIMGFLHADGGTVQFFDDGVERAETKQRVGYLGSGINYYPHKKLKTITAVTKTFYSQWNPEDYAHYLKLFQLDENKTPDHLSAGMKVKYALTLALSHGAELLILDEPTSGLDPVSREELLEIFMDLKAQGKAILFSTHITSDLDKCADRIVYIKNGEIVAEDDLDFFVDHYRLVKYNNGELDPALSPHLLGERPDRHGATALILKEHAAAFGTLVQAATLDDIMIHLEKEERE